MNRLDYDEFPPAESPPARKPRTFESLSLAEALGYLLLRPTTTARQLWRVLTHDPDAASPVEPEVLEWRDDDEPPSADEPPPDEWPDDMQRGDAADGRAWVRIGALGAAVLLALRGGYLLQQSALNLAQRARDDSGGALSWFLLAGVVLVGAELWLNRNWWAARFPRAAGWLRAEFDAKPEWNAAVTVPLVILLALLVGGGGVLFTGIVLAMLAALWIMFLMSRTLPAPAGEGVRHPDHPEPGEDPAKTALHVLSTSVSLSALVTATIGSGQLLLITFALFFSALTYALNVERDPVSGAVTDVVITTGGALAWVIAVTVWTLVVSGTDARRLWDRMQTLTEIRMRRPRAWWGRPAWAIIAALAAVVLVGAAFRLYDLSSTPPEMTSDHIEKLRDALRVSEGYLAVFFPNNGGREAFQMGVVALVAKLPGVGFSFDALKLATVIEGVITLPALWWMARQIVGTDTHERRRLGNWTGIVLAGLVAISAWHVMLSRLGLRIVLTPITTALVLGFLARAMRHNRIHDYVALGLVLGAGVYFYQANRMLPLVVLVGMGLALFSRARTLREAVVTLAEVIGFGAVILTPVSAMAFLARLFEARGGGWQAIGEALSAFLPMGMMVWFSVVALVARARRDDMLLQYGSGLLAAAVVALALYIPMAHYAEINPDQFWNRTRGRMFGEQSFVRLDPDTGQQEAYEPTLREQAERYWDQRGVLLDNYEDALRMFHWQGDAAWINNPHGYPALDGTAGGLLILGVTAWTILLIRQRDPTLGLLPVVVLIMLLPSAMTVAYTIENPSFTRASGTLPGVMMLAALPVGMLCGHVSGLDRRAGRVPVGQVAALAIVAGLLWYGIGWNWKSFFTDYRLSYSYSWRPYSEIAEPLRAFVENEGSFGNAFVIAYPHWLDHRILGTAAGDILWPNGLANREDLIPAVRRNTGTRYAYDSGRPLFVMYHVDDSETAEYLDALFPNGEHMLFEYAYEALEPGYYLPGTFYIFRTNAGEIPLQ